MSNPRDVHVFIRRNQPNTRFGRIYKKKKKTDKITVLIQSSTTEDRGVHLPETRSTDQAVSVGCKTADIDGSDPVRWCAAGWRWAAERSRTAPDSTGIAAGRDHPRTRAPATVTGYPDRLSRRQRSPRSRNSTSECTDLRPNDRNVPIIIIIAIVEIRDMANTG